MFIRQIYFGKDKTAFAAFSTFHPFTISSLCIPVLRSFLLSSEPVPVRILMNLVQNNLLRFPSGNSNISPSRNLRQRKTAADLFESIERCTPSSLTILFSHISFSWDSALMPNISYQCTTFTSHPPLSNWFSTSLSSSFLLLLMTSGSSAQMCSFLSQHLSTNRGKIPQ